MPIGKKKLGRGKDWVRTGGAMGDPTMSELDDFNRNGAGVDIKINVVSTDGGDPNAGIHLVSKKDASEDGF